MLSWSSPRKDDEPDYPEHIFIAVDVSADPTSPPGVSLARVALEPVPYEAPDELQDDVIEPTAVFKPWLPYTDWDNVEITVRYHD
jgi:hypothetical protein